MNINTIHNNHHELIIGHLASSSTYAIHVPHHPEMSGPRYRQADEAKVLVFGCEVWEVDSTNSNGLLDPFESLVVDGSF